MLYLTKLAILWARTLVGDYLPSSRVTNNIKLYQTAAIFRKLAVISSDSHAIQSVMRQEVDSVKQAGHKHLDSLNQN